MHLTEKDKQAINKELTKLLGECWHDAPHMLNGYCSKCGKVAIFNDFFTNEGYGKLRDVYDGWHWTKQEAFLALVKSKIVRKVMENTDVRIIHAFHRDNLAPLMLEFLKQEG